jgi:hypothetical protein
MADLAFAGLSSHLKEKLEGQDFIDVSQVLQRAPACESRAKEFRSNRHDCPSLMQYIIVMTRTMMKVMCV